MTITLHGIANAGGNDNATHSVTPPGSMVSGDLCVLLGHMADPPAGAFSIPTGNDGNQTWTDDGSNQITIQVTDSRWHLWWCTFDGSWNSEDPGIAFPSRSGGNACSTTLIVFRDDAGGTWSVDVASAYSEDNTDPYTITGPDPTTSNPTVALAGWAAISNTSWSGLSGTGWSQAGASGGYQHNVGGGDDSSVVFAYDASESDAALANVEESGGGSEAAHMFSIVFTATPVDISDQEASASQLVGVRHPIFLPTKMIGY